MDTEFPGTAFWPNDVTSDFEYQIIRANVNRMKVIQIGITLARPDGTFASGAICFQFNMMFDV